MFNFCLFVIVLGISLVILVLIYDVFVVVKKKVVCVLVVSVQCSDFYDVINVGWLKVNLVLQIGVIIVFGQLVDCSCQQQCDLFDVVMKLLQGNVQKLLGDFWVSGFDEVVVEVDGFNLIVLLLICINVIKKVKDVLVLIVVLYQVGILVVFNFGFDVDLKVLDCYIGYFMQGGMGLLDLVFYICIDVDIVVLMGCYCNYVKQILVLIGILVVKLDVELQVVIVLEIELVCNVQLLVGINNLFNNYVLIFIKEFNSCYCNLQLDVFLKVQGVDDDLVLLVDLGLFKQFDGMVIKFKLDQWKVYLCWCVGDLMVLYLFKVYCDVEFEFRGCVLCGEILLLQCWESVFDVINVVVGLMVGCEYVVCYLLVEDCCQVVWIVDKLCEVQIEVVKNNSWMSVEVKVEV